MDDGSKDGKAIGSIERGVINIGVHSSQFLSREEREREREREREKEKGEKKGEERGKEREGVRGDKT